MCMIADDRTLVHRSNRARLATAGQPLRLHYRIADTKDQPLMRAPGQMDKISDAGRWIALPVAVLLAVLTRGDAARAAGDTPAKAAGDAQVQLTYAPWTRFCLQGKEAKDKPVCFTGKDGRIESGQPVIAAVI